MVPDDPRTEAEKRHDKIALAREKERLKQEATVSHREKVERMNQYLEAMPIHNEYVLALVYVCVFVFIASNPTARIVWCAASSLFVLVFSFFFLFSFLFFLVCLIV